MIQKKSKIRTLKYIKLHLNDPRPEVDFRRKFVTLFSSLSFTFTYSLKYNICFMFIYILALYTLYAYYIYQLLLLFCLKISGKFSVLAAPYLPC